MFKNNTNIYIYKSKTVKNANLYFVLSISLHYGASINVLYKTVNTFIINLSSKFTNTLL